MIVTIDNKHYEVKWVAVEQGGNIRVVPADKVQEVKL